MTKKYKITFLISAVLFLITFVMFYYMDLKSLTIWTVNIWDTLADSANIRNYYAYSAQNIYDLAHACVGSDILIYIPWAIWNLPIWAIQRFAGLRIVDTAWMLLYSKTFLLLSFGLVLFLTKKISQLLFIDREDSNRVLLLSSTSFFALTAIAYIGQNDVFVIALFLLGLLDMLKGKKYRCFLWFAISVAFKPYFIFSLIVIILYREKNLLKSLLQILACIFLYFVQKLPFIGAPYYSESMNYGPTSAGLSLLLSAKIELPPLGASLFVLSMAVLCIVSYLTDYDDQNHNYLIYYCTAPLVLLFTFTTYEFYRPFYLVPLLYLLMAYKPQYKRVNLILEIFATITLMYFYLTSETLFYNADYIGVSAEGMAPTINSVLSRVLPASGISASTAVFAVCMLFLLIVNHPAFRYENDIIKKKEENYLLFLRVVLYAVPMLFSVTLWFLFVFI